jgi:type III secretion system low calcium response chaperone LcrH/SycD
MEKVDDFVINLENVERALGPNFHDKLAKEPNGMQQLFGISPEVLERYYSIASKLLEEKQWEKARDAFLFLLFLNPCIHNFWIGLGVAEQSQQNFKQALLAYMMAETTDSNDPVVYANAFQCHLALGSRKLAMFSFQMALDCCDSRPGNEEFKSKLFELHKRLVQK